ncbi:THO complex subunit 7 homolog [Penaeus indicus]|uniref:THO complex subunit 7 homolog n=1 Tax=Penaeus indicus TaxID=29960 RepID=UPI00300D70EF
MGDEEIIRRRLMIDGDGTGDARVMMMFMKSFIKWCSTDDSPQECQNQFDRLLTQLASIEHSSLKWKAIVGMNQEEIKHYELLRDETSRSVEDAYVAIGIAKQELEEARQVRRNRLEYDALARLIKEHPPRSDTANKLAHLTQHLHSLKASLKVLLKVVKNSSFSFYLQPMIYPKGNSTGDTCCVDSSPLVCIGSQCH